MLEKEVLDQYKNDIDNLTQYQMAYLWRFAESCHPYFDSRNEDLATYFSIKFKEKGGMTPEISKSLKFK